MPTGYTQGILDGKITTFPEFAKLCTRAFGATIHMRDEDMGAEYTPRVPSDFYQKELLKAKEELELCHSLSDEELMDREKKKLLEEKGYQLEAITKAEKASEKLSAFLEIANTYVAPTPEHKGIQEFMIEQLDSTIRFDGDSEYYLKQIGKIEKTLSELEPVSLRVRLISEAKDSVNRYKIEYAKEVKRCEESNKWMDVFLASLP